MKVCYINLDSATDRRDYVEQNFRDNNALGWGLERISAIEKTKLAAAGLGYSDISDVEAGCFASHADAIARNAVAADDLMVVEDDVMFGPQSQRIVQNVIDSAPRDKWDILFTDMIVPGISTMLTLYDMRRRAAGKLTLIDVAALSPDPNAIPIAGSTAYVVNRQTLPRLAAELGALKTIESPYDVYLWRRIAARTLSGHAIFPFPTTISRFADSSQIHSQEAAATELLWNAFRRLVWVHGNLDEAEATLARIAPAHFDDRPAAIMAKIVQGMISRHFTGKWVFK